MELKTHADYMSPEYQQSIRDKILALWLAGEPRTQQQMANEIGISLTSFLNFVHGKSARFTTLGKFDAWIKRFEEQ